MQGVCYAARVSIETLRRRVEYLCSDVCAGREAGSPEGNEARRFIVSELRAAGLDPIEQPVPGCRGTNVIVHLGNVGAEPAVLIGAHYDHIGRALGDDAYWGADDNAAAVAILLGLADRLASDRPPGPVILVAFDGEEPPHFLTDEMGSTRYCEEPSAPLESIDLAVVMDLVGHAIGPAAAPAEVQNTLFCMGAEKSKGTTALVAAAATGIAHLAVRPLELDVVPPLSDYEPFRRHGVPVLFLTCGRWRHYHEITDTPDRLAYPKIAATQEFLERLARRAAADRGNRGRYQPEARDYPSTIASLRAVAAGLVAVDPAASMAVEVLDGIAGRVAEAPITVADWSRLLEIIALMERGLA